MTIERRASLRSIPLFREFNDSDCDAALSVLRVQQFSAGDYVFKQGDRGDTMVIVVDGRLRVEIDDGSGKRTELGAIQSGEIVGEMAALDPAPRSADVIAASDTVVFALDRSSLQRLREVAPAASAAIVSAVIGDVTRRLRRINERIDKHLNPNAQAASAGGVTQRTGRPVSGAVEGPTQRMPASGRGDSGVISNDSNGSLFSRIWSRLTGD